MENKMLFAGFGGQGVLLMGQLLCKAAMHENYEVSWMPSYGPEMRGGEAYCGVVVADEPIGSPLVTEPDVAVIMNRPSLDKFEQTIRSGGILLYNSSLIDRAPVRTDVRAIPVKCAELAQELGNARVANMVMLGALNKASVNLPAESLVEALRETLGKEKEGLIPINRRALEVGASSVASNVFRDIKTEMDTPGVHRIISYASVDGSPEGTRREVEKYQSSGNLHFFGWLEGGEALGICGFEEHPDIIEVHLISVDESARGRGIGGGMIARLQAMYRKPILAETDDGAIEFYRKVGFNATDFIHPTLGKRWRCILQ